MELATGAAVKRLAEGTGDLVVSGKVAAKTVAAGAVGSVAVVATARVDLALSRPSVLAAEGLDAGVRLAPLLVPVAAKARVDLA